MEVKIIHVKFSVIFSLSFDYEANIFYCIDVYIPLLAYLYS